MPPVPADDDIIFVSFFHREVFVLNDLTACRVLAIQSLSKDADVQKRVLQTMVMVVTWKSCDMTEDTVAQARPSSNRRTEPAACAPNICVVNIACLYVL